MSVSLSTANSGKNAAVSFISFLNKSVTPYHVVKNCVNLLKSAGFKELLEKEDFTIVPSGKYFVKKNETTIFAFAVGGQYKPGNGFSMIAAHTDSPCLRLKPNGKRSSSSFLQLGVATYGGGLWRTWFDRDLSLAGNVLYLRNQNIYQKLINLNRPILFIPSLAIHLDNNIKTFEFNKETELLPIFATTFSCSEIKSCKTKYQEKDELEKKKSCPTNAKINCSISPDHHDDILNVIAAEANCEVAELLDFDLYLYDTQPASLSGLYEEFISGARLDNLVGAYTAINGLIDSVKNTKTFESDPNIRVAVCYDNEEVGSQSAQGAQSSFTEWMLRRLSASKDTTNLNTFERAIAKSCMISADQAHACHPNYSNKHEENHRPNFHGGVVVKINVNQRYATTSVSHSILKVIADKVNIPLQKVVVRNDSPCGSTVGPILSALLGMQTIDVGCAQLAMHSIREITDTSSIFQATTLFSGFYEHYPKVFESVKVDADNK